ncbi:hypothetical protein ABHI18_008127 [Aspergillus niger]
MQASKDVPLSDPALDRPRLKTDMCKNVDLPMSAFAINHLVSSGLCLDSLDSFNMHHVV